MNSDLLFGGLMLAYGIYTLYARFYAPHQLSKMEPMKKMWGESAGTVIHILAYTVVPLVAGGTLVLSALAG